MIDRSVEAGSVPPLPIGERSEFAQRIPGEGEGLTSSGEPTPSSGPSGHLLPDGEKGRPSASCTEFARRLRRAQTDAERKLWSRLRAGRLDGWKFKRQVPKGQNVVDFCCSEARLIIELDGGQHAEDRAVAHDAERTLYLQQSGYRVLRFWNSEIFKNLDGVMRSIQWKLQEPPLPDDTPHSLYPSGRGFAEASVTLPLPIGERSEFARRIPGEGEGLASSGEPTPSSGPSGHLLPDGEKEGRLA